MDLIIINDDDGWGDWWMDGWMDGWIDACMKDWWIDGLIDYWSRLLLLLPMSNVWIEM